MEKLFALCSLEKIRSLDLSWTKVSVEGLKCLLPSLLKLETLYYETPIILSRFPAKELPQSVLKVYFNSSVVEYADWSSAGSRSDAKDDFERLHHCHMRSKMRGVTSSDPMEFFYHIGFGLPLSSSGVVQELTQRHFTAKSVHLQCNSQAEGAWEPGAIEDAIRAFPTTLVDLEFICARTSTSIIAIFPECSASLLCF